MKVHLVAIVLGLSAIAYADVRDILNNPQQSIYANFPGQPFSKQGTGNKQFWWAETGASPFTRQNAATHNTHNTLHNTPQQQSHHHNHQQPQAHTKRHDQYAHNPFMQQLQQQQQSDFYAHMASLSGAPNDVNGLMTDANFARYARPAPKIPCYGASQVCAPKDACRNGFISESDLGLVQSQANVSRRYFFFLFLFHCRFFSPTTDGQSRQI
jgi:hypothetical protein